MRLVCACTGDEMAGEYNFALLELPEAYIEWLRERLRASKAVQADEADFYAMEYFDHQVSYYSSLPLDVEPESGEFVRVSESFQPDEEPLRVAATTVCITDDSFVWKGHPKHSGGQFETATMAEGLLRDLQEEVVGHLH